MESWGRRITRQSEQHSSQKHKATDLSNLGLRRGQKKLKYLQPQDDGCSKLGGMAKAHLEEKLSGWKVNSRNEGMTKKILYASVSKDRKLQMG